jgi:hypothetical protein
MNPHPSYLALDRAALGEVSEPLRAHLSACSDCSGYVASLHDAPIAGELELRRRVEQTQRAKVRKWWAIVPVAAAACGLLFLGQRTLTPQLIEHGYVGAKGFPSVWIYVKHGNGTELWDGKRALFAGDKLRLKVDPGHFRRVEVYSVPSGAAPERLFQGDVRPGESFTLPDAWELDAAPGTERLVVVLSNGPVSPAWTDWLQGKVQPGVSVLPFELPKTTDVDAGDGSP